jgi:hypothetical protein
LLEDLIIYPSAGTFFIPEIRFYTDRGEGNILGESYLEDTFDFYQKIERWIEDYFEMGKEVFELNLKLRYFNTSSNRAILSLLQKLREYKEMGKEITVNWHYPNPDDNELLEEGQDFEADSGIAFTFVEYPEED